MKLAGLLLDNLLYLMHVDIIFAIFAPWTSWFWNYSTRFTLYIIRWCINHNLQFGKMPLWKSKTVQGICWFESLAIKQRLLDKTPPRHAHGRPGLPDFNFGFSPVTSVSTEKSSRATDRQTKGHPLFVYEEFRPVNEFHELIPTVLPVVLAKMIAPYCAPSGGTYPMAGQLVPQFEPDCDIRAFVRKSVQLRCFHQSLMFRLSFGGANNPCTNMFHCRQCALGISAGEMVIFTLRSLDFIEWRAVTWCYIFTEIPYNFTLSLILGLSPVRQCLRDSQEVILLPLPCLNKCESNDMLKLGPSSPEMKCVWDENPQGTN